MKILKTKSTNFDKSPENPLVLDYFEFRGKKVLAWIIIELSILGLIINQVSFTTRPLVEVNLGYRN